MYFENIEAILVALIVTQLQVFASKLLILNFYQVYFLFISLQDPEKDEGPV